MKKLSILLSIYIFILLTGCTSTCMEYRSATTAARSEKNLKRAEEWGLKALEAPECSPANNSLAPYFLATEVYLQQKNYVKMAEMLNIAEQRNPDQPLETPFKLGDTPVQTIGEGIEAFRDQEWTKIYNNAVELIQRKKVEDAKRQIETAILIHPKKGENYSTLTALFIQEGNMGKALSTTDRGLEVNPENSMLYQMKADILLQSNFSDSPVIDEKLKKELILLFKSAKDGNDIANYDLIKNYNLDITNYSLEEFKLKLNTISEKNQKQSPDLVKMENAKELYLKAIEYSNDPGPIMRKLLFVYIDMGNNQKAIAYSNELLNKYPNDADLYYNVGVLYQRLTLELFDPTRGLFLETTPESEPVTIKGVYDSFKTTRQYAYNSKDYFLQANDLELDENLSTHEAVSEMRKLMDQIDEIFIPSIRETAHSAGIELD